MSNVFPVNDGVVFKIIQSLPETLKIMLYSFVLVVDIKTNVLF